MQSVASTSSVPPSNASSSPYRTKVTLACDVCRKRRIKCSGTSPCSLCAEGGQTCVYNDKPRGKRGPRPRKMLQRVIHDLAPAASQTAEMPSATPRPALPPAHARRRSRTVALTPRKQVTIAMKPPILVDEGIGASDSEDEDEDEDGAPSREIPDLDTWRPALERLFAGDDACWKAHPSISIGLLCHLLELFYSHASTHLQDVVPASYLFSALISGDDIRALLLAMCANCTRFSAHPAAGSQKPGYDGVDVHLATSSQGLLVSPDLRQKQQMDHVRTLCVLVEYEASQSRGRCSWAHIGTARSLVQLAWSRPDLTPEDAQILESADDFLSLAEQLHSLGQPALQAFLRLDSSSAGRVLSPLQPSQLPQIISLLVKSQQLSSNLSFTKGPMPWMKNSAFSALQSELDEYILKHPGISLDTLEPPAGNETTRHLDATMSLLVCHCTRIMLNKPFLPVPKTRPYASADSSSRPACLEFPGAPTLFLMERARRCEASAAAVFHIARHVISNGDFFSYMGILGFACVQGALVLVNQLHRGSKPPSNRTIELLKFDFLVLAAVRKFHWPARHWLDVLFRAHEQKALAPDRDNDVASVFGSFFDRYEGLDEPFFVPLDPDMPMRTDPRILSRPTAREAPAFPSTTSQPSQFASWMHMYSNHLSEEMHPEDEASVPPVHCHDVPEPLAHEQSAGVALMQLSMGGRDTVVHEDMHWPDARLDELSSSVIMSPTAQYSDMVGMDLDIESLFGPIPMFDDSPEMWANILNGISFPG
ncbi:hypothetical protein F5X68DRAFT_44784 [Plectosphaerella plurivora]|uniref:Zn(2)-C6 fungal-type domain-containing protein n=1 Tax=Plectosphaerella plurivora TaxID=936078 RepID=A0A9P9A6A9_9PEZI|nr:hypothetical protein F5X68DRAFT_44784 [Plectosphaerella plurivora]